MKAKERTALLAVLRLIEAQLSELMRGREDAFGRRMDLDFAIIDLEKATDPTPPADRAAKE